MSDCPTSSTCFELQLSFPETVKGRIIIVIIIIIVVVIVISRTVLLIHHLRVWADRTL